MSLIHTTLLRCSMATSAGEAEKCSRCKRAGHSAKECTVLPFLKPVESRTCARCKAVGHLAKDCKVPSWKLDADDASSVVSTAASTKDGKNAGGGSVSCFLCFKTGHLRKDCPFAKVRVKPCTHCGGTDHGTAQCKDMICFECKKKGHLTAACPQRAERLAREQRAYEERKARRQAWLEWQQRKEDEKSKEMPKQPRVPAAAKREESPPTPEVRPVPEWGSCDLFPPLGGAAANVGDKQERMLNTMD